MKVIDLLNKIANGEEVPKKIKYQNYIYEYQHRRDTESSFNYMCNENGEYLSRRYFIDNILNDEVEIIEEQEMCHKCGKYPAEYNQTYCEFCLGISEEEKKIPEKLPEWATSREDKEYTNDEYHCLVVARKVDEIIDYLDYLKSKGE